jgi:hypothetical protein
MGEIAEDMINGASCALCGCYFEHEHDYPVACKHCWKPKCGYQKAIFEEAQ